MVKVTVYNKEGKEAGQLELADAVFGVTPKETVIHQVYLARLANARESWAHTKDRGDVRGGGKKPWKQKGTGRARHGSIRSPIWKGGGVTFGPLKDRNYTQKVNKKMNATAVRMCLSSKVIEQKLVLLEAFTPTGKTKEIASLRQVLPGKGKTTLFVTSEKDEMLLRGSKNIPQLDVVRAADMNIVDLLHHQYVIMSQAVVKVIEKRLLKEKEAISAKV